MNNPQTPNGNPLLHQASSSAMNSYTAPAASRSALRSTHSPATVATLLGYLVFCLIPLGFLVAYLDSYGVTNIPQLDDFEVTINFIQDFRAAQGFGAKLGVLWESLFITEHRMPLPKSIFWLMAEYGGELNYETLAWVPNLLALTGILTMLAVVYHRSTNGSVWGFLPIPFLAVSVQYFEVFTWPTCSFFYLFTTFFVVGAIFLMAYSFNRPYLFALSLCSALCAAFSYSNGIFVFPCLVMVLALQYRYKAMIPVILLALPIFVLYFWEYKSQISSRFHGNTLPSLFTLTGMYFMPIEQLRPWATGAVMWAGLLLLAGILYFAFSDIRQWIQPFFGAKKLRVSGLTPEQIIPITIIAFLAVTLTALVLKRSEATMNPMYPSRYRYLSAMLAVLCYLRVVQVLHTKSLIRKAFIGSVIPLSLLLYGFAYPVNHAAVINMVEPYKVNSSNYAHYQDWCLYKRQEGFWRDFINKATNDLVANGLWERPRFFSDKIAAQVSATQTPVVLQVEHSQPELLHITNLDWKPVGKTNQTNGTCLVLRNAAGQDYTLSLQRNSLLALRRLWHPDFWLGSGFGSNLWLGAYPAGTYQVFLYQMQDGVGTLIPTNTRLTL